MMGTLSTGSPKPSLHGLRNRRNLAARCPKRKIATKNLISLKPIPPAEQDVAERILARLVALAYAADHPSLFLPPAARVEEGHSANSTRANVPGSTITA